MTDVSGLRALMTRERLHRSLRSTKFVPANVDFMATLHLMEAVHEKLKRILRLCNNGKLPVSESLALCDLIEEVCESPHGTSSEYDELAAGVLPAIRGLADSGSKLFRDDSVLSRLNSAVFSLTGRHDRVHDVHFQRKSLYWLDPKSIESFENAIQELLRFGSLQPADLAPSTSYSETPLNDTSFDLLQSILICFGSAISRTLPSAVFVEIPSEWKILMEACASLRKAIDHAAKIRKHRIERDLEKELPTIRMLINEAREKRKQSVSFESFLRGKPGIREVRVALQQMLE